MSPDLVFEGRCWKFGHNVPTDAITPTWLVWRGFEDMARHCLEALDPEFPKHVQPGDILVAGRNFGCSSGRAVAPKAIQATGVAAVVAEKFSRTFYRNSHEVGLPVLEAQGVHDLVEPGDLIRVDIRRAMITNAGTGQAIRTNPPPDFLLRMLEAGGLIPFLEADDDPFAVRR